MADFELVARCLMALPLVAAVVICAYLLFSALSYPVYIAVIAAFLISKLFSD